MNKKRISALLALALPIGIAFFANTAYAARYSSSSYLIDASVDDNFGDQTSSSNYKMTAAGGESITGIGASTSYKIGMGYTAQLIKAIQITTSVPQVMFSNLIAGTPQTGTLDVQVQTDAPSYTLGISQNNNMTTGIYSIPAISPGSIASPMSWTDGTTKGLGFTISAASQGVPAAWSGGTLYAAVPGTTTTFFTRNGQFSGTDTTTLRFKVDVSSAQQTGDYINTLTLTGTMVP